MAASKAKELQVFDGATFAPIKNIPTADRCWHFSFTPDDSKILLVCGRSNEVLVFDANTYAEIKRISGKELPWGVVTYPKSMGTLGWKPLPACFYNHISPRRLRILPSAG